MGSTGLAVGVALLFPGAALADPSHPHNDGAGHDKAASAAHAGATTPKGGAASGTAGSAATPGAAGNGTAPTGATAQTGGANGAGAHSGPVGPARPGGATLNGTAAREGTTVHTGITNTVHGGTAAPSAATGGDDPSASTTKKDTTPKTDAKADAAAAPKTAAKAGATTPKTAAKDTVVTPNAAAATPNTAAKNAVATPNAASQAAASVVSPDVAAPPIPVVPLPDQGTPTVTASGSSLLGGLLNFASQNASYANGSYQTINRTYLGNTASSNVLGWFGSEQDQINTPVANPIPPLPPGDTVYNIAKVNTWSINVANPSGNNFNTTELVENQTPLGTPATFSIVSGVTNADGTFTPNPTSATAIPNVLGGLLSPLFTILG